MISTESERHPPNGAGFVEYPVFERGYEALKAATNGFSLLDTNKIFSVTVSEPISILVLMILATRGKVFTAKNPKRLVECTRLREFKTSSEQAINLQMFWRHTVRRIVASFMSNKPKKRYLDQIRRPFGMNYLLGLDFHDSIRPCETVTPILIDDVIFIIKFYLCNKHSLLFSV